MARKIEVQIVGDADSFHKAIGKATQTSSKFGSILGSTVRAGAYAAAGGIVAVGAALKVGFDEFSQHQKVAAQTGAVLKSTGGAANVTAKHIEGLANQLLNLSGVDDELIQSGENVLLTFRNIRNAAGKGNDIFDRATKATLDLSVAMDEDLRSASLQVGKALNDPVKGLTALKRVGVQFTDAQTNLIKKLVDTGKTAEAQKIILAELNKEFGGSAKAAGTTLAGQLGVLKEQFKNTAGEIVGSMLPYMIRFAKFALPLAVTALQAVGEVLKTVGRAVGRFADHFLTAGDRAASAGNRIRHAWGSVRDFFQSEVMPIIHRLQRIFQDSMAAIAKVVQSHGDEIRRIAHRVGAALQAIGDVAMPILRSALVKALPKAIGVAITALDKITAVIQTLVSWVMSAISQVNSLGDAIKNLSGINLNQGLLGALGIDVNKGLLGQVEVFGGGNGASGGGVVSSQGRASVFHIYLDGKEIHANVKQNDQVYRRQNGRSAFA